LCEIDRVCGENYPAREEGLKIRMFDCAVPGRALVVRPLVARRRQIGTLPPTVTRCIRRRCCGQR
jgi:hypothetical protein